MSGFPGLHHGRVAVVTGAANGLGQAYALRLARDGARVIVADIADGTDTVAQIGGLGGDARSIQCDVSSSASVQELYAFVADQFGSCDILVNNAGVSPNVSWEQLTFEEWKRTLSINLDSMFLTCQAFTPAMRSNGFGRIVNISSNTFGLVLPGFVHYVASKGGVIGFTRALATDLGAFGITVNAVLPGLTKTATTESMWEGTTLFADMAAQQAVPRPGEPADLEATISFLASEEARWITGQSLVLDGGLVRH